MEQAPRARDREQEEVKVSVIQKLPLPRPVTDAAWEPVEVAAVVRVKGKAEDRAAVDEGNNHLEEESKGGDRMPGFDRTGPMGAGSMTGGARGLCIAGTAGRSPAYGVGYGYGRGLALRRGFRGGYGPGRGWGRGYGRGFGEYPVGGYPADPAEAPDEINTLKAQADYLKNSLDADNRRIDDLESKSSE